MRLESPHQLYWLIAAVAIWFALKLYKKAKQKNYKNIFSEKILKQLFSNNLSSFSQFKSLLTVFGFALIVVALARPQSGHSTQEVKSEGVEIMFAVDVSESMMSEDLNPNRLMQATQEVSRLMELLQGNKMGLVAFAGSAAVLSPLTTDPSALKLYLESLSPLSVSSQGTNFASALEEAKVAFERGGVGPEASVTRVVVLFSDGEDHAPGALEKAKTLAQNGIITYAIGYGTEAGGRIPVRDQFGFLRGFKKDQSRNEVITSFKPDALTAIAQAGRGQYFKSQFAGPHLKQIVDEIQKLQKTQFETSFAMQYEDRFQIFLLAGILLLLLGFALPSHRQRQGPWMGRFATNQSKGREVI